ncbi:DUF4112 domain-containing protein [Candidatus Nitronereus thalassa]|uniref:DUF4112 domain-containing protein n=1 Tax=Candidatus Nitronereus thalassa TaxID=3020898 RepID=A0ABU3K3V5_9BACT|nr:DUF4112 domain-containing protein [Candidatus Nitronereus thalassa]MDT7041049.1 DUF4112 domain-containing protein [Candidatus Nitronereus thalassa]
MDDQTKYRRPTVEPVLEEDQDREQIRAFADFIARLMDSAFLIPGTRIRIGLDPLLGLLPGAGDIIANLIGSSILFLATQLQVPKIIMVRMALNMGLNTVIGAIPGFGDLFSVWFRSNEKNAQLLRRHTTRSASPTTSGDWVFVIGLTLLLFISVGAILTLIVLGIQSIWKFGGS